MQYSVSTIDIAGKADWEVALLMQDMGDMGYETFEEDGTHLLAYIQTALITPDLPYPTEPCPDENWNAVWEQEHPAEEVIPGVWIEPHCAFGAGHHETTRMMIGSLMVEKGFHVLDMGCGTGVLGIVAAKKAMENVHVTMVDIDDKSVENTRENILLNALPLKNFTLLCQGTVPEGKYDLILANIHRNILLAQMADYSRCLRPGGRLQISGFYEQDVAILEECAAGQGLKTIEIQADGDWRMVVFEKISA